MADEQTQKIGTMVGAVLGAFGGGMIGKAFGGNPGAAVGALLGGGIGFAIAKPPKDAAEFDDEWDVQPAAANPQQMRDRMV